MSSHLYRQVEEPKQQPHSDFKKSTSSSSKSSLSSSSSSTIMSQAFYSYGKFCVCHPWEVIVAFFCLSICIVSIGPRRGLDAAHHCSNIPCPSKEISFGDVVLFTISASLAIFYVHRQFRSLVDLGSKYLIVIATLFTVVSSLVFASGVINLLNRDFSELINSMPLFLLLTQLPKAISLAQFALSSSNRDEVRTNIAKGMAIIGPCLTINTISWTLAIGIGTLPIFSGVKRMEDISYLTCLSFVVNYIIFMTFFPACLSLALELSHTRGEGKPVWQLSSLAEALHFESEQTPNPVIQRVKIIMSAGLMLVHILSRWQTESRSFPYNSNASTASSASPSSSSNSGDLRNDLFGSHVSKRGFEPLIILFAFLCVIVTWLFLSEDKMEERRKGFNAISANTLTQMSRSTSTSSFPVTTTNSTRPFITVSDGPTIATKSPVKSSPRRKVSAHNSHPFFIGDGDSSSVSSEDSVETANKEVQTEESNIAEVIGQFKKKNLEERSIEELHKILTRDDGDGAKELTDEEVIKLVEGRRVAAYQLEKDLGDSERGVLVRRMLLEKKQSKNGRPARFFDNLPYRNYDYDIVLGACCENVVGYMPIPVGVAGPLLLDGKEFHVPMATTEGCLVASTNRGCRALFAGGGVKSRVYRDGMTRAPTVKFASAMRAADLYTWLKERANFDLVKEAFDSSSRFARLSAVQPILAGCELHIRLVAETGDAMGMNMLSKGAELVLSKLKELFPDMEVVGISGNVCTDKKPAAINWIEGRGKSVICEAVIPAETVASVLKTDVQTIVKLNVSKNLIGSALAGSIGGFNAHSANIVTAIFIATGQDPAQNVGSSNCMTLMDTCGKDGKDLKISCTMPSIEVGTIGGGTILKPQAACLEMLGVRGSCIEEPGRNSKQLSRIVCATVLAAELSIMSAIAAGHLVRSHMKHNRSNVSINASVVNPTELNSGNRSASSNHLK